MSYTTTTRTPTRAGWLVSLMLVTFAIGTDDFVIAGILPDIADDLAVSEAAAGQLVTVFSITYALAAPGRDGRALGVVAGLTVSLFIGIPLGSLLADTFGWRSTFVAVAGFSILVALSNARLLPRLPGAPEIGVRPVAC